MDGLCRYCLAVLLLVVSVCGERIELPAYEYLRTFNRPLILGQCPNRVVSYPQGSVVEECTYPSRTGDQTFRTKSVDSKTNSVINDVHDLFKRIGLCDDQSAAYFGLLVKGGDCLASDIANKLSFKPKHVTLMYLEHYRPRTNSLRPSVDLNIPSAYTMHLQNTYYTDHIGIGTDEAIITEMQFKQTQQATKARTHRMSSRVLSHNLEYIAKHIGIPKKVKIIRLSTSDKLLQTKVFKGKTAMEDAINHVKQCEKHITLIRQELKHGKRNSHLKYGFKTYEIIEAPRTAPLRQFIMNKQELWENVTMLQVEANRVYMTNRRFRKFCRGMKEQYRVCPLIRHSLKELKRKITKIHTQRRDWSQLNYEQRRAFEIRGRQFVKLMKTRLRILTKSLKKVIKTNKKSIKG